MTQNIVSISKVIDEVDIGEDGFLNKEDLEAKLEEYGYDPDTVHALLEAFTEDLDDPTIR